jgi:hypothetical protein
MAMVMVQKWMLEPRQDQELPRGREQQQGQDAE